MQKSYFRDRLIRFLIYLVVGFAAAYLYRYFKDK